MDLAGLLAYPVTLRMPSGAVPGPTRLNPPPDTSQENRQQVQDEHLVLLLARCEAGNETAFEELYALCASQLYALLLRILRIEALADDALQDSFVKIWQKAGSYDPRAGSPMVWLRSVARHQALDLLRRRGSREDHERYDVQGLLEATPDTAKPVHEMAEDSQHLLTCLDQLPEATSRCIVRAYCEGYSHEELAEETGAPLGTVKSWIRRGLLSLRKCIDALA